MRGSHAWATRRDALRLAALGASAAAFGLGPQGARSATSGAGSPERLLRFTLHVTNATQQVAHDQTVRLYAPVQRAATQELIEVTASAPFERSSDDTGQTMLAFRWPRIAPMGTAIVTVSARVRVDAPPSGEPVDGMARWLVADSLTQMDDPNIRAQAELLSRDTPTATAQAIYEWVSSSLQYAGYVADEAGAADALKNLRGDCTEYAYLCAALARANKIAARVVGGYVAPRDATPKAQDFHDWTQMHVDGAWRTVDAQLRRWGDAKDYVAFVIRSESRAPDHPMGRALRFRASEGLRVQL